MGWFSRRQWEAGTLLCTATHSINNEGALIHINTHPWFTYLSQHTDDVQPRKLTMNRGVDRQISPFTATTIATSICVHLPLHLQASQRDCWHMHVLSKYKGTCHWVALDVLPKGPQKLELLLVGSPISWKQKGRRKESIWENLGETINTKV